MVEFEPAGALFESGRTEAVAAAAVDVLAPDGALVLEIADGRAAATVALLGALGYRDVLVTPDLAGAIGWSRARR